MMWDGISNRAKCLPEIQCVPWATIHLKPAKTVTGGQQKQLSKEGENNLPLTGSVQGTGLQIERFGFQTAELTQGK